MVRDKLISALCLITIAACGGRAPNPVAQYQPGDERRSCEGLRVEIANNEAQIARLLPGENATGKNVALGVAGAFVLVPWFFMDFKDGERIEIEALRKRNAWLREVAFNKDCSVPPPRFQFEEKPEEEKIDSIHPSVTNS